MTLTITFGYGVIESSQSYPLLIQKMTLTIVFGYGIMIVMLMIFILRYIEEKRRVSHPKNYIEFISSYLLLDMCNVR